MKNFALQLLRALLNYCFKGELKCSNHDSLKMGERSTDCSLFSSVLTFSTYIVEDVNDHGDVMTTMPLQGGNVTI